MRIVARAEIDSLGIGLDAIEAALDRAFRAGAAGQIAWRPKSTVVQPDGAFFISTLACWPERGLAVFHSIAGAPPEGLALGEPTYRTWQLLTDYRRGTPVATIDGAWTSRWLPAGVTALAARRLARPDSRVVAFVGAGDQARANLDALRLVLPLETVRIFTRSVLTAERFATEVRVSGLRAEVTRDADAVLDQADVVVTSVPSAPSLRPFLDPQKVAPGAFVSAVDVGRSWRPGLASFERTVTDDRAQAQVQRAEGRFPYEGDFDTELPELLTGARPGRRDTRERIVAVHPGNVVGVFGLTALLADRLGLI